jgi:Ca2+/Na+ antiporter
MINNSIYEERLSSTRTTALFLGFTILFLVLFIWRVHSVAFEPLAIVFLCFSIFFLFYAVNYRTLKIRITQEALKLTFGIFTWTVPIENIENFQLDRLPVFLRLGGAGIHFFVAHRRYRVSFNFLEYTRVVVALKRRSGLVRDVSFSTRHPDDVMQSIREAISVNNAA